MSADQDTSFARLVSLACHDLRTPLATVSGFARTIRRNERLEDPLGRYVDMIAAAADQMTELLETLALAARVETGRFDAVLLEVDTLEVARAAAQKVGRARAEGEGAVVDTDAQTLTRSVAALVLCALRHGGVAEVLLAVRGREIVLSPIGDAAQVIVAEDLKDLGAAVAVRAIRALGGSAKVDGDALRLTV
jgi:signal transduction histidine kinase